MATADCIDALVERTGWVVGESQPKDWKRVSKRNAMMCGERIGTLREFEHKPSGRKFFYKSEVDEDDDGQYIEGGTFLYSLSENEEMGTMLTVTPKAYWEKNKAIWDQHMSEWLAVLFDLDETTLGMDELRENKFLLEIGADEAQVILDAAGLVRSPEIEDFLRRVMS